MLSPHPEAEAAGPQGEDEDEDDAREAVLPGDELAERIAISKVEAMHGIDDCPFTDYLPLCLFLIRIRTTHPNQDFT
jgi:hypothetical protein